MAKSLSITIHPSAIGAEFLSVSDAMRQVLDVVESLERAESIETGARNIVWRLTDAHTNSPPFTVTAEAFSVDPAVSIALEASRLTAMFASGIRGLLEGHGPSWMDKDVAAPLKRALQRNLNGIGRTEISVDGEDLVSVSPANAKVAFVALERMGLDAEAASPNQSRVEFGAIEVEVHGITRWYEKPALMVTERLSRDKAICVLTSELAEQLGTTHKWGEAWEGRRLLISGTLHYDAVGVLKRIEAEIGEDMPWTRVELSDLAGIDLLDGRSVREHVDLLREDDLG